MRALTVKQPWAAAMFMAEQPKNVENRTWSTDYRGDVAVHAGKAVDRTSFVFTSGLVLADDMVTSGFLGVVRLVDVHKQYTSACYDARCEDNVWAEFGREFKTEDENDVDDSDPKPIYHWMLDSPRPFETPVSCSGSLGLWTPKLWMLEDIYEQLRTVTP